MPRRVVWHRLGALAPPAVALAGLSPTWTSSLSLASADAECEWRHVYVVCASSVPASASTSNAEWAAELQLHARSLVAGSARCAVQGHPTGFTGVGAFESAAVAELAAALVACGRSLEVLTAPSTAESWGVVLSFAATHSANEVHTVASRDMWQAELDISARMAMTAGGVSAHMSAPIRVSSSVCAPADARPFQPSAGSASAA
jgi:hypothetical protein